MIPKGSGPNGTIFEKEYHWGLAPLVSFLEGGAHQEDAGQSYDSV